MLFHFYTSSSKLIQFSFFRKRIPLLERRTLLQVKANNYCTPTFAVFDRNVKRIQKNRAATAENSREFDYLREEVARRLLDRLDVCVFFLTTTTTTTTTPIFSFLCSSQ
jgi:hypothetical protein